MPPPPSPPPMIVSPTGSSGWFQNPPTKKRRCRTADSKVSFGPDETLAYIETAYEITQEEKDSRWYQFIELKAFKQSAKTLYRGRIFDSNINITKVKEEDIGKNYDLIQDQNYGEEEEDDSIRGMGTYHPSRVRYCKKFIKHVLLAYHVKCGPDNKDHVALLSTKWSTKNTKRGIETGKEDFYIAYELLMPTAA